MRWRSLVLSLLLAAVAFHLPARPGAAFVPAATAEDAADAEALVQMYLSTFNAPDPIALASLYAEDGLVLPPSGGAIKGRDAIRSYWSGSSRRALAFNVLQKTVCGEAGFFVGRYGARDARTGRFLMAGSPLALAANRRETTVSGNFTLGLRRADDGKWRISTDMWTEDLFGSGFTLAAQPKP
jgi:ketosteroid isomerase-like protein